MEFLTKMLKSAIEEYRHEPWFKYVCVGLYATALIGVVFVPDIGHHGTGMKDIAISAFDVGTTILSFLAGSKLK